MYRTGTGNRTKPASYKWLYKNKRKKTPRILTTLAVGQYVRKNVFASIHEYFSKKKCIRVQIFV